MVVGIELARAMEPLTFFQMKVFNAQLAIRYKSATKLNTQAYCEKTRYERERGQARGTKERGEERQGTGGEQDERSSRTRRKGERERRRLQSAEFHRTSLVKNLLKYF